MRVVLAGGTGNVGGVLQRAFVGAGHDVVVLTRHPRPAADGVRFVGWDARTVGPWAAELDGAGVVVGLAGKSVSCRYTDANLRTMMASRVDSTRAVGAAISRAEHPPAVWLQASTATIYADTRDRDQDELTGVVGGDEPHVPLYWEYSVRIATRWEAALAEADLPHTRRVALRSAMVMSPGRGSIFDALSLLTRLGLGGAVAGGGQYVSWIHDVDFVRAVEFLLAHDDLAGPVDLAAPGPMPQRDFMRDLRHAWGVRVGLPATAAMAGVGAWALRSDPELLLKSRRVVPTRLLQAGFAFEHPQWAGAARDLVDRVRTRAEGTGVVASARALAEA